MNAQDHVLAKVQPGRAREFFFWVLTHNGFRRFETADECFGDCGYPDQGRWDYQLAEVRAVVGRVEVGRSAYNNIRQLRQSLIQVLTLEEAAGSRAAIHSRSPNNGLPVGGDDF